jgi:hypothetical protein
MKLFSSLDTKDRRMLYITLGLVLTLILILGFFTPGEDPNTNTVPDSFLSGQHGAKAAFTLLKQTGYPVRRWEQPLADLASIADQGTVLIVAGPGSYEESDKSAIQTILEKGGRVLTTGFRGGLLLPGSAVTVSREPSFAACEAQPDGLQALAGQGPIWIVPYATWDENHPEVRTDYTCGGQPVVVEYPVGNGTAIWWASSTPLENGSIQRGQDLELLLNSIGPAQPGVARHIYWDESLHSPPTSQWDYVSGPVWPMLLFGTMGIVLLAILSFSRRSGPVRPLPQMPRTTPIEFLEALGALYRSTGATATALQIAWERFRTQTVLLTGQRNAKIDARELAASIERRFGSIAKAMEPDLIAAEEACWDESLKPRRALALVQSLRRHEETLRQATSRNHPHSNPALESTKGAPLHQPGATP